MGRTKECPCGFGRSGNSNKSMAFEVANSNERTPQRKNGKQWLGFNVQQRMANDVWWIGKSGTASIK